MAFDLGAMLKDVSNLDTNREQIEYIRLDLIDSDPNNFYQLSGIDQLADNIATCGLQQPIRVRPNPEQEGRFVIVSGHRRRAAVELLAAEEPEQWQEIACIVEREVISPALQQLRLIYANANTRTMTSAEINEQAAQVEKLLYQLKEEGYEFPGRMRDHVAEAVNVSKTKLARLKVIRENLASVWVESYKSNVLTENTAYALARMPEEEQKLIFDVKKQTGANLRNLYADAVTKFAERFAAIDKLICEKCGNAACRNAAAMKDKAVRTEYFANCYCTSCCESCYYLNSCKDACPEFSAQVNEAKAIAKEAERRVKRDAEERDRPKVEQIQELWTRFGYLRQEAGMSVEDVVKVMDMYYRVSDDKRFSQLEDGFAKVSTETTLPYGYTFTLKDAQRLISIADAFGCSLDVLLCRDPKWYDVPESDTKPMKENVSNSGTWRTGDPDELGTYILLMRFDSHAPERTELWEWNGACWEDFVGPHDPDVDGEILGWIPMPGQANSPLNNSCKTGMSPNSHCGAAACCEEPVDCCLNCGKECNMRCGWMEV